MAAATIDPDGFARAILLTIVPSGYRLIDTSDTRFPGVREHFSRLALKHVGAHPCLVGFCADGQDPRAAAEAAAGWAKTNLVPNAIQRRVSPGVLVIALPGAALVEPGAIPGTPVPGAVWTLDAGGRLRAAGRPPGTPAARTVRAAVAPIARGQEPPTIGQVDVAERTRMAGGGARPRYSFALPPIVVILLVLLGLRFLPGLLPHPGGPRTQAETQACQLPDCVRVGAAENGQVVQVSRGQGVQVAMRGAFARTCFHVSEPSVVTEIACAIQIDDTGTTVVADYQARAPGDAVVSATTSDGPGYGVTIRVR